VFVIFLVKLASRPAGTVLQKSSFRCGRYHSDRQ